MEMMSTIPDQEPSFCRFCNHTDGAPAIDWGMRAPEGVFDVSRLQDFDDPNAGSTSLCVFSAPSDPLPGIPNLGKQGRTIHWREENGQANPLQIFTTPTRSKIFWGKPLLLSLLPPSPAVWKRFRGIKQVRGCTRLTGPDIRQQIISTPHPDQGHHHYNQPTSPVIPLSRYPIQAIEGVR